jgi:hypothetical protein
MAAFSITNCSGLLASRTLRLGGTPITSLPSSWRVTSGSSMPA